MNIHEAIAVVESEGLQEFASFSPELQADKVYLVKQGAEWSVYATDERAAVYGTVSLYPAEGEAIDEFLSRLRSAKRMDERRRSRRQGS